MYIQKLHHFCNKSSSDEGQIQAESTWEVNNHGTYISQFPPNIIKSIMSIMFNEICIYVYIYSASVCYDRNLILLANYYWRMILILTWNVREISLKENELYEGKFVKKITESICILLAHAHLQVPAVMSTDIYVSWRQVKS